MSGMSASSACIYVAFPWPNPTGIDSKIGHGLICAVSRCLAASCRLALPRYIPPYFVPTSHPRPLTACMVCVCHGCRLPCPIRPCPALPCPAQSDLLAPSGITSQASRWELRCCELGPAANCSTAAAIRASPRPHVRCAPSLIACCTLLRPPFFPHLSKLGTRLPWIYLAPHMSIQYTYAGIQTMEVQWWLELSLPGGCQIRVFNSKQSKKLPPSVPQKIDSSLQPNPPAQREK